MTTHTENERGAGSSGEITPSSGAPASSGSRTTQILGMVTLVAVAIWVYLGLVGTPADEVQQQSVRLLYVHVPVVSMAYLACFVTSGASAVWLWKRTQWWDLVASSAGEIAAVFTAATLVSGSIWGGTAWGTFWTWDARLTSTALLFLLLLGYLAVRRIPSSTEARGRISAIVGLLLTPNIFVINRSVEWWRSLHQNPTVFDPTMSPKIHDLMLFTMMYSILVGLLVFAWLLIHRFRVAYLQDQLDERGIEYAIEERRAEAGS